MRIAMIYGRFCSGGPDAFDVETIYESKGLTGSESFFFNTAKGLAELGHEVHVICDVTKEIQNAPTLGGAHVYKLDTAMPQMVDAVFAWNEPDLLRGASPNSLRICVQQLNDWNYCAAGYDSVVDIYAFPSATHREFMIKEGNLDPLKTVVMPNSYNPEFYEGAEERDLNSVAYCSSPDRGLHWLLEYWPHIRKQNPKATLSVYYTVQRWLDSTRGLWYDQGLRQWYEIGFRARYIEECLKRLGRNGENGVFLVGPVSNKEMARRLMKTQVLAYTCDTVRWTEGYSVTIMDAIAAGCEAIISDVDAIGEVYKGAAQIIPGRPTSHDKRWISAILKGLETGRVPRGEEGRILKDNARATKAETWVKLITENLAQRKEAA